MKITDKKVDRDGMVARARLVIPLITATSQTGVVAYKYTPGYAFIVKRVRTYNANKAGAVAGVLKVGARTSATVTFTDEEEAAISLSGTAANNKGTAAEAITLEYTTDGTGALTNGYVTVEIVPAVARR